MTAVKKAADTTAQDAAKDFDVEAFLAGFTPYLPPVRVHRRGDLKVRIDDLLREIEAHQSAGEESIADDSVEDLIRKHNALVDEFEADVFEFQFRPLLAADLTAAKQAAKDAGVDFDAEDSNGEVYLYYYAQTITSPAGMDVAAFKRLRQIMGDTAMVELKIGWDRIANGGDDPKAPFSRSPLPTRIKDESDKS